MGYIFGVVDVEVLLLRMKLEELVGYGCLRKFEFFDVEFVYYFFGVYVFMNFFLEWGQLIEFVVLFWGKGVFEV